MMFPKIIWVLCAVALLISSIGFKKYVWFISLGYGFSIAGEGLAMLLLFRHNPVTAVACSVFILYGCRLGGYLAYRELKSGTYARHMQGEIKETVPFGVKIAIWITCAALYVLQVLPVFYRTMIRMNVDNFDEAIEFLTAHGFRKPRHETASKTVDTGSSRFTMLVAPSGYILEISQHIE